MKLNVQLDVLVEENQINEAVKLLRDFAKSSGYSDIRTKISLYVDNNDLVSRTKKRYFAMVDELGKELGYLSKSDRELWKAQVKKHLGGESIAEMKTYEEISTKIEELHVFARTEFNYYFNPNV